MNIPARPWTKKHPPKRILAIRLQAMGDMVITLPYLQFLKNHLPEGTVLDLLTREEMESIPRRIRLFNKVYSIGGGRSLKKQMLHALLLLPGLIARRYDAVIDLQNNGLSRLVRRALRPGAWSAFDRFSCLSAGERTRATIEALGLGPCGLDSRFITGTDETELLIAGGWKKDHELLVLNPAGAFETRNWPLDNYLDFTSRWLAKFPKTQFLIMGTKQLEQKAGYLKKALGDRLIDLSCRTTPGQAFAILQQAILVLSEDSGLMHMSWVSGIPTLAIFGSTRSDWSRPLGSHSFLFDSADLECGNCMLERCMYGDNHCLTRLSAARVFERAVTLIPDQQKG